MPEILRTPIEPLKRDRRTALERVGLAAPWLAPWMYRRVLAREPRSRYRRWMLARAQQIGWQAAHRRDWDVLSLGYAPAVELRFEVEGGMGPDLDPSYRGTEAMRKGLDLWFDGFDTFRAEPRELIDPGGARFGGRADQVARTGEMELRRDQWAIWWFGENGLITRQGIYLDEDRFMSDLTAPTA